MIDQAIQGRDIDRSFLESEIEACVFTNCKFHDLNLSAIEFIDCTFIGCSFNNVDLTNASFKEVTFEECDLFGVDFSKVNLFLLQWQFKECNLRVASFYGLKMERTIFTTCNLSEVDFEECNLQKSSLDSCEFKMANFLNTNLQKAVFDDCTNLVLDPSKNKVKGCKVINMDYSGLLFPFGIEIK